MLRRARAYSLTTAALLVLTLVPGGSIGYAHGRPIIAASRTGIGGIKTDSDNGAADDPLNPAHPLFSTADAQNVEFVGHVGGATYAVAVQGDPSIGSGQAYAYIGEGPRLTILDISNPASPTAVGKTPPLPGIVQYVAVAGGYAYVAD